MEDLETHLKLQSQVIFTLPVVVEVAILLLLMLGVVVVPILHHQQKVDLLTPEVVEQVVLEPVEIQVVMAELVLFLFHIHLLDK